MTRRAVVAASAALALWSGAGSAEAHTGVGHVEGFAAGVLHPFSGLDHVLAMGAVGVLAARLRGRALWELPVAFLSLMVAGAALAAMGVGLPGVEVGIAASVVVLGGLLAAPRSISGLAAAGIVGAFAVLHGYAHGAEIDGNGSGLAYGIGFVLATGTLHLLGIGLGWAAFRIGERPVRLFGAAMAVAGVVLMIPLV